MSALLLQGFILARSIGLPLVVESIVPIIPIDGPIVYPLIPLLDRPLNVFRHIVNWNHEVRQGKRDALAGGLCIDGERRQLEESNVTLFDGLLYPILRAGCE